MTASDTAELVRRTDEIADKHPHYWRDEAAQAELRAIWGEGVNANGVFAHAPEEVLFDRDGYKAAITIGAARDLFAFGSSFQTPTQGYGGAPSVWEELYQSHAAARTAAIEFLLKRLPEPIYPHEEGQRGRLDRLRQAVSELLRQPSLF